MEPEQDQVSPLSFGEPPEDRDSGRSHKVKAWDGSVENCGPVFPPVTGVKEAAGGEKKGQGVFLHSSFFFFLRTVNI